ncbi:MAG: hypothetical protein ACYC2P_08320 [Paludibacteraceae bacterium]
MKAKDFNFNSHTGKRVKVVSAEKEKEGVLLGLFPEDVVVLNLGNNVIANICQFTLDEIINITVLSDEISSVSFYVYKSR